MSQPRGFPGKYDPLNAYLATLPPEQDSVQLTLVEIEALLGAALPASAWTATFWSTELVARSTWRLQGWRAVLNRPQRNVTFTRGVGTQRPTRLSQADRAAVVTAYHQGTTVTAWRGRSA